MKFNPLIALEDDHPFFLYPALRSWISLRAHVSEFDMYHHPFYFCGSDNLLCVKSGVFPSKERPTQWEKTKTSCWSATHEGEQNFFFLFLRVRKKRFFKNQRRVLLLPTMENTA